MASSVLIRGRRLFASSGRSSTRPGCRGRWGPAFRRLERSPEELGQDRHCRPGMCERARAHACTRTRTCTCSHTCSQGTHTLTHARTRTHMPSHTCTHGASRQTWERCPENTHFSRDTENAVHSRDLGDVWPQQDGNLRPRLVGRRPPRRACALPRAALPSRGSRRGGQPPAAPHTSAPAEESARLGGRVGGTEAPRAGPGAAWAPPRGTSRPQAPFCPRPLCMWNHRAGR